jgi:UTP--glucose-1-phosphate uridylyltransferase
MKLVRKAVIPVAGMGTRFLPATKAVPKELLPLLDKPVLQYIVEEAVAAGIEQIIFITNDQKGAIERYFSRDANLESFLESKGKTAELEAVRAVSHLAEFVFVPQSEPLGLGHAVLQARSVVGNEPFIVFGGDDVVQGSVPAAQELIDVYQQQHGSVIGVLEVPGENISRYGVIDPVETLGDRTWRLRDIVEKPTAETAPSQYGVGGRWLLQPEIFDILEHTPPGAGNEIQLTDAIRTLMDSHPVFATAYSGIYRDCGNKIEYLKAVFAFALSHPELGPELRPAIKELMTTL